jgi:RNA polymerase sigma-70 factor (ECF subfamily)
MSSVGQPSVDPIDAALAQRVMAASGGPDSRAEAELCRRFAPRIRLFGLRHLRDQDAAHDLVQITLEITLQKLRAREVHEPARIASFILGVARLQAHQLRRRHGREVPTDVISDESTASLAAAEPETLGAERVAECLQALGERERSVVVMSFYGDLSSSQVAKELGLSAVNARVIRHRAVEHLRQCMGLEGTD